MEFKNTNFEAELHKIYLVDTTNGDIVVILPDISEEIDDISCGFIKKGSNNLTLAPSNNQLINDSASWLVCIEWKRALPTIGNGNWYIF